MLNKERTKYHYYYLVIPQILTSIYKECREHGYASP